MFAVIECFSIGGPQIIPRLNLIYRTALPTVSRGNALDSFLGRARCESRPEC
jgi:hypothetical protein